MKCIAYFLMFFPFMSLKFVSVKLCQFCIFWGSVYFLFTWIANFLVYALLSVIYNAVLYRFAFFSLLRFQFLNVFYADFYCSQNKQCLGLCTVYAFRSETLFYWGGVVLFTSFYLCVAYLLLIAHTLSLPFHPSIKVINSNWY